MQWTHTSSCHAFPFMRVCTSSSVRRRAGSAPGAPIAQAPHVDVDVRKPTHSRITPTVESTPVMKTDELVPRSTGGPASAQRQDARATSAGSSSKRPDRRRAHSGAGPRRACDLHGQGLVHLARRLSMNCTHNLCLCARACARACARTIRWLLAAVVAASTARAQAEPANVMHLGVCPVRWQEKPCP